MYGMKDHMSQSDTDLFYAKSELAKHRSLVYSIRGYLQYLKNNRCQVASVHKLETLIDSTLGDRDSE